MKTEKPRASADPWWQRNIGGVLSIAFVLYVVILTVAHFASMPSWFAYASGFAVEKLGQLGDSFGPLTAMFAAIAAWGAWRSYDAQRQQLDDERNRHRGTRFDETFFRLLDHYDREIAELFVVVPDKKRAFTKPGKRENADAVAAFKQCVKIFQFEDKRLGSDADAFAWGFTHKFFNPLSLLRDQEIAITRWLKRQSKNVKTDCRGALLVAKLSDDELWFWYYSILSTGDVDLIAFANELGIEGKRVQAGETPKPGMEPEGEA